MIVHPIWLFLGVGLFKVISQDHSLPKSTVAPRKKWIYHTDFISCTTKIENHLVKMFMHPIWLFYGVGLFKGMSKDHFIPKSTVTPGKSWIYQTCFVICNSEIEMYLVKMIVYPIWLF